MGYGGITLMDSFRIPSDLPVVVPFRMDARILLAGFAVSLLSALICGLVPALQCSRADLVTGLKAADVDVPGRKRLWGRNLLVVAQVSMSLMLLTASFLMARGFQHGLLEGIGFAKDHLLMARFDPRLLQYNPSQTERFYQRLAERVRDLPGVRSAGLTQNPPLGLDDFDALAFVPEGTQMPRDRESFAASDTVEGGYFDTMGSAILRARALSASDTADTPRVAVVNEQFAKHYWPHADAVGQRIRMDNSNGAQVEIVGVAQTIKYHETSEPPTDFIYLPLTQSRRARMVLLMRTTGEPLDLVKSMKDVVRGLDPNLPILEIRTYEDLYRYHAVEGPRVAVLLIGTMGFVGLLLAVAGLYGLISYNVSRRTREIGIRMAIGAGPGKVLSLVMGKGIWLVGIGTALGLTMGFAVERMMNSMLFNTGGVDVVAYVIVVPSMFAVTMLAAYLPARRATGIAPTQALRCE